MRLLKAIVTFVHQVFATINSVNECADVFLQFVKNLAVLIVTVLRVAKELLTLPIQLLHCLWKYTCRTVLSESSRSFQQDDWELSSVRIDETG